MFLLFIFIYNACFPCTICQINVTYKQRYLIFLIQTVPNLICKCINIAFDTYPFRFTLEARQRIAIARAVFSDRPVLILDECTSSLDEETERRLLANLRQMTDKTVLIITHRPAALEICDRRIEMANE